MRLERKKLLMIIVPLVLMIAIVPFADTNVIEEEKVNNDINSFTISTPKPLADPGPVVVHSYTDF